MHPWTLIRLLSLSFLAAFASASPVAAQSGTCPTGFEIPAGQADGDFDCVPDGLEITGYAYTAGQAGLRACTPGPADCYVTDPTAWSSDGDPYSDFQEATGINMDNTVEAPFNHPLVGAVPRITVRLQGYVFQPIVDITNSRGQTLSSTESYSETTTESTSNSITVGGSYTAGVPTASAEGTREWSSSTATTEERSSTQGFDFSTATGVNTAEAALLSLNIRVANEGGATVLGVRPTFNVYIAGDLITTIVVPEANKVNSLTPGEESAVFVVDRTDGGANTQDITLTLPQLESLVEGAPLEIDVTQIEANVQRWNALNGTWQCAGGGTCDWDSFESQIEARTLRLGVDFGYSGDPNADVPARYRGNPFEYYVYTGTPSSDPEFTLEEVLGFVGLAEGSGASFRIGDRAWPDQWIAVAGPTEIQNRGTFLDFWNAYATSSSVWPRDLRQMPMPRGVDLTLLSPDTAPGAAGPFVTARTFSSDLREVEIAATARGGFRPVSATAHLWVHGEEQVIEMDIVSASEDGAAVAYKLPAATALPISVEASYVEVADALGNVNYARRFTTPFGTPETCADVPPEIYADTPGLFTYLATGNRVTLFVDGDLDKPASAYCYDDNGTPRTFQWAPVPRTTRIGTLFTERIKRGIAALDAERYVAVGKRGEGAAAITVYENGNVRSPQIAGGGPGDDFYAVAFREGGTPGQEVGIAVGRMDGNVARVARTTDGGRTWAAVAYPGTPQTLQAIDYAGGETWYAAGGDRVIRSTDNGLTWASVPISLPGGLRFGALTAVEFVSETEGVIGDGQMSDGRGRVYATTNGASWALTEGYTGLEDIAYNGANGWAVVGGNTQGAIVFDGDLLSTSSPGTVALSVPNTRFVAVDFGSTDIGFAVATDGRVWRTADGGRTWAPASAFPARLAYDSAVMTDVFALDENVAFVASDAGSTGWTTSGGGFPTYTTPVVSVNEEAGPEADLPTVVLDPAYPNPVRGRATIPFRLGEAGPVRLSVVDLLGREVAVLADGARPAGAHEVALDTSGLAAGVYVVRLVAGSEAAVGRITVVR